MEEYKSINSGIKNDRKLRKPDVGSSLEKLYITLLTCDEGMAFNDLSNKIRIYEKSIRSIVNKNKEKFVIEGGKVKLNYEGCPNWVKYMKFIQKKGKTNMKEIAMEYNKRTQEVYIEVMRKREYINAYKDKRVTELELKEGLV